MTNFKICPSLFSPAEHFVPHVHILQWCASCRSRQLSPGDGIKVYPEVGNPEGNHIPKISLYSLNMGLATGLAIFSMKKVASPIRKGQVPWDLVYDAQLFDSPDCIILMLHNVKT